MHIFHKWNKWKVIEKGNVTELNWDDKEIIIGTFKRLEKECVECGIIQIKKIKDS